MKRPASWQAIRTEALRRIHTGLWSPGARIPDEAELAAEFSCARATVNRALRSLAEDGLLERRRKGGTRVPTTPVRKATFEIAIIRQDIEGRSQEYGYRLIDDRLAAPPAEVLAEFETSRDVVLRHVTALHFAEGRPFCLEDRWLNPQIVKMGEVEFGTLSANEWLVRNIAYSGGKIGFHALAADRDAAGKLECAEGAALFAIERTTRNPTATITFVRLTYAPGYRMEAKL
ncbi:GntR family transcriptional regulator [Chelativorans sp. ZYF759]|uniref:GntR family transcriptional regulator n=1 Tax=Chelativorans sp. ZYF759 TaxID=2692213 RepID=UPI00145DD5DA|nr:GntR family transcriptional regulator [Chelativorans sp. ZYF759]NMG39334.1 GntR family transcriptional regulator [Chelativorans sp. ZYF759]